MKQITTRQNVLDLLETIFGCSGCVIDNNTIIYPSELEDGYTNDEDNILGFYTDEYSEDALIAVTIPDMIGSTVSDEGLITLPNDLGTIQLLTQLNIVDVLNNVN